MRRKFLRPVPVPVVTYVNKKYAANLLNYKFKIIVFQRKIYENNIYQK